MIGQSDRRDVTLRERDFEPHHNPCAQCGQAISHPSWSEGDVRTMSFVWTCDHCGYEFTTIAVYSPLVQPFRMTA